MKQFTLNRFGVVEMYHSTSYNQCKTRGWTRYDYHVKITTTEKLDEDGFVIEHNLIHKAVERATVKADSCEKLCIAIEKTVLRLLKRHDLTVVRMYIKIQPKLIKDKPDEYAFMEFEASY